MKTYRRLIAVMVLLGSLFLATIVLTAPAALTLERFVISSGGGHTEGGSYTLEGTIGQPAVGAAGSAPFDLCTGFWCGPDVASNTLYLPLVIR